MRARIPLKGQIEGTVEAPVQKVEKQLDFPPKVNACNMVTTRAQKDRNNLEELPFYNAELEAGPIKKPKSRAQRK